MNDGDIIRAMIRHLLCAVIAVGLQYAASARAGQDPGPRPRPSNARPSNTLNSNQTSGPGEAGALIGALQLDGDPTAVRLKLRRTSVTSALGALAAAYPVTYRSAVTLDDLRDGTYKGPLRGVIARLLAGYDYVIAENGAALEVSVLGKSGERSVPSPTAPVIRQHRIPVTTRISRAR
jgi:hypothetical protein